MASLENSGHVVVVDDDPGVQTAARLALLPHVQSVLTLDHPDRVDEALSAQPIDVVLLDMNFAAGAQDGREGLDGLSRLRQQDPTLSVVLMTAYGGVALAVEALKRGAVDFILKPWRNEKLIATIGAAAALTRARRDSEQMRLRSAEATARPGELVGVSPGFQQVFRSVRRAASVSAHPLIHGENGVGKERIARELHALSDRAAKPFVAVDLAAVPEAQMESELFGHKRAAVPGADSDRAGRIQAADGGVLFLDEIACLPRHLQSKLQSVLERGEIWALGAARPVGVDIRLISTSRRPLEALARDDSLIPALAMQLGTVEIRVPPLRERREDIAVLLEHFLSLHARRHNVVRRRLSAEALRRLEAYDWPGNIRELRYAAERATWLAGGERLEIDAFPFLFGPPQSSAEDEDFDLEVVEKRTIGRALLHFKGNISLAAKALGLTRPALYRRMSKHGL